MARQFPRDNSTLANVPGTISENQFKEFIMAECDSPECLQALARLQDLRNRILTICSRIEQFQALADNYRALALMFAAMAALLLAAGLAMVLNPLTLIAGVATLITAGVLFLVSGLFAILAIQATNRMTKAQQDLLDARGEFSSAVQEVMATCDPECWDLADFDQPECPGSDKAARSGRTRTRRGCSGDCTGQPQEDRSTGEAAG